MKTRLIYILTLLLSTGSLMAQTLEDYLLIAGENNPGLQSIYLQYRASAERVQGVGSLPDPELGLTYFLKPMERYMGNQLGSISLMQMFPWPGTLDAAKDEMAFIAKAKLEEFNESRSGLFFEVRAAWFSLHLLEEQINSSKESLELLYTIEQIALARFRGAEQGGSESGSMAEVLRLQMEIKEVQNSLRLLEESKTPAIARFNRLLNRPAHESIVLSDTITPAQIPAVLTAIPDSIRIANPQLRMLEHEEAAFKARERLNKKMGLPVLGLGLQYDFFQSAAHNPTTMKGWEMLMPMGSISIPLWRKKYSSSLRETDFMRLSLVAQKEDMSNQLMVDYEEVIRDFNDAQRRLELYREQSSLAGQLLNILIAQYSTGSGGFEEVLRVQQQLLDYRLNYLQALIDGNMAVAMMQRLMGN